MVDFNIINVKILTYCFNCRSKRRIFNIGKYWITFFNRLQWLELYGFFYKEKTIRKLIIMLKLF